MVRRLERDAQSNRVVGIASDQDMVGADESNKVLEEVCSMNGKFHLFLGIHKFISCIPCLQSKNAV